MPSSLFKQIRDVVKIVPFGKVLTYGDVAEIVGIADARKVGWALHGNQDKTIPCHRIVKKNGYIAASYQSTVDPILRDGSKISGFNFAGPSEQKVLLEREGVTFISDGQVDMEKYRWQMSTL